MTKKQTRKRKPLARILRSKATTGLALMRDVRKAILAEPKRANMRVAVQSRLDAEGPACGTVGCIAGWTVLLHDGRRKALRDNADTLPYDAPNLDAVQRARHILGRNVDYETVVVHNEAYSDTFRDVFNDGGGDACSSTHPGTPEHAAAVAARIDQFVAKNRAALKARRLRR